MLFVRYGLGVALIIVGFVLLVLNLNGFGVEGFSMAVGGGLAVLLLNWMFRLAVSGDRERDREEAARRYFDEHGHWPGEKPRRPTRPPPGFGGRR